MNRPAWVGKVLMWIWMGTIGAALFNLFDWLISTDIRIAGLVGFYLIVIVVSLWYSIEVVDINEDDYF